LMAIVTSSGSLEEGILTRTFWYCESPTSVNNMIKTTLNFHIECFVMLNKKALHLC